MSPRDITDLRRTKRYPPDAGQELCKRLRNSKKDRGIDDLVLCNSYAPHKLTDRSRCTGYHDPDKVHRSLLGRHCPWLSSTLEYVSPRTDDRPDQYSRLSLVYYFVDKGVGLLVETASLELIGLIFRQSRLRMRISSGNDERAPKSG